MENQAIKLILHLDAGPAADEEDQARFTQGLRRDLLEQDVESVDPIHFGAAPVRAKGDPVTLTALAVTLAPIALTEIMKALQTWLSRHERATVSIESEGQKILVTGSPSKEQQQMIETFIGRHHP